MNLVNIEDLFSAQQKVMEAVLDSSELLLHPGDNGDNSEEAWRSLLQNYLPKRYAVSKATVIDCNGKASDQIDIVIYDRQYSYLVMSRNGTVYIPAESVYAAFEVKPKINKQHLIYASKKAESVRSLNRTSIPIQSAGGRLPAKELHTIIFGILAKKSGWSTLFGDSFKSVLGGLQDRRKLDCGCCLSEGSFFVVGKNLIISHKQHSLITFIMRLVIELQKIGTVPAIDLNAYLSNIDSLKKLI